MDDELKEETPKAWIFLVKVQIRQMKEMKIAVEKMYLRVRYLRIVRKMIERVKSYFIEM